MEDSEKAQATNAGAFFVALKSACPSIRMRGGGLPKHLRSGAP